jgi:glycosyltransferase involved in cell wall biosynthesis
MCSGNVPPSLVVVILTHNEEIHIERCIRSLLPIASKIFIVDSFSTDRTIEIANSMGARVAQRKWINYADQFQWGLNNCGTDSEWVMRMDADEYLEPGLQKEIEEKLPNIGHEIDGVYLNRKHYFYDQWIRYGGRYPLTLLRIWKNGKGRIEQRWMDEHIILPRDSKTIVFKENLVDDNLKGITFYINKLNSYSTREAIDVLNRKYHFFKIDEALKETGSGQAKLRRVLKDGVYAGLPISMRAFSYFIFRYIFQLGFLDGWNGFIYHLMQGFWYRFLVDIKVYEIEREAAGNSDNVKKILSEKHGVDISCL